MTISITTGPISGNQSSTPEALFSAKIPNGPSTPIMTA